MEKRRLESIVERDKEEYYESIINSMQGQIEELMGRVEKGAGWRVGEGDR